MNTQHTIGPFSVYENAPGNKHRFLIHDSAGQTVAVTTGDPDHAPDYYRALANARLIAAAPDLLDIVDALVGLSCDRELRFKECDPVLLALADRARAAYARATGDRL